jgi:hypothetical protein
MANDFPFDETPTLGVFITRPVWDGGLPILLVTHEQDGDWQFLCGTTEAEDDVFLIHLAHVVDRYPEVREVADLPAGWYARREGRDEPWVRSELPPD